MVNKIIQQQTMVKWKRNVVADSLNALIQQEIDNIKTGDIEKFDFILGKEK